MEEGVAAKVKAGVLEVVLGAVVGAGKTNPEETGAVEAAAVGGTKVGAEEGMVAVKGLGAVVVVVLGMAVVVVVVEEAPGNVKGLAAVVGAVVGAAVVEIGLGAKEGKVKAAVATGAVDVVVVEVVEVVDVDDEDAGGAWNPKVGVESVELGTERVFPNVGVAITGAGMEAGGVVDVEGTDGPGVVDVLGGADPVDMTVENIEAAVEVEDGIESEVVRVEAVLGNVGMINMGADAEEEELMVDIEVSEEVEGATKVQVGSEVGAGAGADTLRFAYLGNLGRCNGVDLYGLLYGARIELLTGVFEAGDGGASY